MLFLVNLNRDIEKINSDHNQTFRADSKIKYSMAF